MTLQRLFMYSTYTNGVFPAFYLQWHAFSMPELKNFLRILQREEEEHVKQIVQRYALARFKMQEALAGSTPG